MRTKQRFKITIPTESLGSCKIVERDYLHVADTTCTDKFTCLRVKYDDGTIEFIPKSYDGDIINAEERYGAQLEECFQKQIRKKK